MRTERKDTKDTTIEVSVRRGSRARLELPADVADRLKLKDGDKIPALIGRTTGDIEHRLAVERWIREGAEREMTTEEFIEHLGRAPSHQGEE